MLVDVINTSGEKVSRVELPEEIFGAPVNVDLMHQALMRQLNNLRQGNHNTRGRGEVRGGGAKPWKQKGTGRARQGSRRASHWVGGGVAHGPHPRSYRQAMPRQMRRAALRSALSVKLAQSEIVVLDTLQLADSKTSSMRQLLSGMGIEGKTLILLAVQNEAVEKSARNLQTALTLRAGYLNVRDLLYHEKVLMPLDALEVIKSYLGAEA